MKCSYALIDEALKSEVQTAAPEEKKWADHGGEKNGLIIVE